MGCNHCDDCSDCSFGGMFECDTWKQEDDYNDYDYDPSDIYCDYDNDRSYSYEEIDEQFQDAAISAQTRCSNCNASICNSWNYCVSCGSSISGPRCPACKQRLFANWRYCPICGTDVDPEESYAYHEPETPRNLSCSGATPPHETTPYQDNELPF